MDALVDYEAVLAVQSQLCNLKASKCFVTWLRPKASPKTAQINGVSQSAVSQTISAS
jgi:hypothetical protein